MVRSGPAEQLQCPADRAHQVCGPARTILWSVNTFNKQYKKPSARDNGKHYKKIPTFSAILSFFFLTLIKIPSFDNVDALT